MKTIQMTLDDSLVEDVDKMIKKLNTSRSAFSREALRKALERENMKALELKHKKGYEKKPVNPSEFSVWEPEQDWGEG